MNKNSQLQIRNSTVDFLIFTRQNNEDGSEFEKYRFIQDKTYQSDFDKLLEYTQTLKLEKTNDKS